MLETLGAFEERTHMKANKIPKDMGSRIGEYQVNITSFGALSHTVVGSGKWCGLLSRAAFLQRELESPVVG